MRARIVEIGQACSDAFRPIARFGCLFGSIRGAYFNDESDVDLAIYSCNEISFENIWAQGAKLAEQIERKVDVVDLRRADPIICMQVLEAGELIFADLEDFFHQFKARKISEYLDFKRSRAIVERSLMDHPIIEEIDREK